MAEFVIATYHRNLNEQPLGVKELVEGFKAKRKRIVDERHEKGNVIHEETRKRVPANDTTTNNRGSSNGGN